MIARWGDREPMCCPAMLGPTASAEAGVTIGSPVAATPTGSQEEVGETGSEAAPAEIDALAEVAETEPAAAKSELDFRDRPVGATYSVPEQLSRGEPSLP